MSIMLKNTLCRVSMQRVFYGFFFVSQICTLITDAAPVVLSLDRIIDFESTNSTKPIVSPPATRLSEPPITVASLTQTHEFPALAHMATAELEDVIPPRVPIQLSQGLQTSVLSLSTPTSLPVPPFIETITFSVNTEDSRTTPSLATTPLASFSSPQESLPSSTIVFPPASIYSTTSSRPHGSSTQPTIQTGLSLQATEVDTVYTLIVAPTPTTAKIPISPSLISDPTSQPEPFKISNHLHLLVFGVLLIIFVLFIVISIVITHARRINWYCNRRKRIDYGLDKCIEQDMEKAAVAARSQQSSQGPITSLVGRETWIPQPPSQRLRQERELARLQNKVIDIVPDFPRSRFSVTSSDLGSVYDPFQIGETEDDGSNDTHTGHDSSPLIPPTEFFSLPSTSTISTRHSRRSSAPVFGRYRRVAGLSIASYRLSRAKSLKSNNGSAFNGHRKSRSVPCGSDHQWF